MLANIKFTEKSIQKYMLINKNYKYIRFINIYNSTLTSR